MSNSSNLLSSKTRLILVLFSCLGATAFYCNQPQSKNAFAGNGERGINSAQTAPTASFLTSTKAPQDQQQEELPFSRLSSILSEKNAFKGGLDFGRRRKKPGCRCPENEEHDDDDATLEDRREALFAAMGGLWAVTTATSASTAVFGFPDSSHATAGVDANMAFPDVIGGMNDRNTKQCLVEDLGIRQCLVYKETDPDKLLYKGANAQILLDRTKKATAALRDIPALVEKKKWNDINGILIGPMGELSSTMTLLCGDEAKKIKLARKVKEDLFAMGTANTQRQQEAILKYHAAATKDLAKFLEVAL